LHGPRLRLLFRREDLEHPAHHSGACDRGIRFNGRDIGTSRTDRGFVDDIRHDRRLQRLVSRERPLVQRPLCLLVRIQDPTHLLTLRF
jgi:hypothetical protein